MAETNIILGYGETLTRPQDIPRGGSDKAYPYSIEEQRLSLGAQFDAVIAAVHAQPANAKARGESVIKMTLHPTFLAKSFHPNSVLAASGLRCVGSKSSIVTPRKVTTKGEPKPTYTAQLFVAGSEVAVMKLYQQLRTSQVITYQEALRRFELVAPFSAQDKLFIRPDAPATVLIEVALHASKDDADIINAFSSYVASLGGEAQSKRALSVAGLTFLPVAIDREKIGDVAEFAFVRVVRTMPALRVGGRSMRAVPGIIIPALPLEDAVDPTLKVGVFDGGIGHTGMEKWVSETIIPGTESTSPSFLKHGNGVTSALLFGPLDRDAIVFPRPYANVQHYRVISPGMLAAGGIVDVDLYDVLHNIESALSSQKFDALNFSLGPNMPVDDDEVHPWTALIDRYLADGQTLATIAVGNDGEKPWPECRIQPPSDMVNAIAVGACDSRSADWKRASYSSYGPGRSPGLVKPDGLAFGGSDTEQFTLYNPLSHEISETTGTSFGSPALLRTGIGIRASLSSDIQMLAVRALLSHHASRPKTMPMSEVGHGRFPQSVEEVITCGDNEVRVIYQGVLTAGQNLRASIPFPTLVPNGRIKLRATLSFASQTDPEHAVNYTRAGLTVTLRPKGRLTKTMAFFSAGKMYTSELQARTHEQKWETTLKHEHDFNVGTLDDPLFDITYGAREEGQSTNNKDLPPLPYAMVVTLSVENTPGVYNNIRQRYQTLQPLRLRQEIGIRQRLDGNS
ncbi:peptidase S8 [Massilia eurypsychrophila]|uniref:Peptidase S8 n=1 Tax=Massilia eurypsychrophila TaxID=1485217 RepID=A0A2G8T7T6_9BURK|nr:S8 family peptidase [Massilia eurypsychrophila]PIL42049.1 peptidase S8 [Massilia eurypsychrophila]